MVTNGYIRSETDPEDRRSKLLFPTEKAEAIYPRVIEYLDGWNESLTGTLNPQDQETLIRLLRHLSSSATERVREKNLASMLDASEEGS